MKHHILSILLLLGSLILSLACPRFPVHEVRPTDINHTKLRDLGDIPSHGPGQYACTKVTDARRSRRSLDLEIPDSSASALGPGFDSSVISPANIGKARNNQVHDDGNSNWNPPTDVSSAHSHHQVAPPPTQMPKPASAPSRDPDPETAPDKPESGFHGQRTGRRSGSGNGDAGIKATYKSRTADMHRPLSVGAPLPFERSIRAGVLPANEYQGESIPLTRDSGMVCPPLCAAASHTMANPFRYLTWLVGKGRSLHGNIGMTLPLRLYIAPLAFSKGIKAAVLPVNKYQAENSHSKRDGGMDCGAPLCSAASNTKTNPFRYPVWMFAEACSLFGKISARAMSLTDRLPTHINGLVTTQLIDAASSTKSATNTSEKVGGYAPMERGPSNSSAPHSRFIPFARLFRSAMLPIQALGMPAGSKSPVTQKNDLSLEDECGKVDVNRGRNAQASLGLGSALVRMWQKMRDW